MCAGRMAGIYSRRAPMAPSPSGSTDRNHGRSFCCLVAFSISATSPTHCYCSIDVKARRRLPKALCGSCGGGGGRIPPTIPSLSSRSGQIRKELTSGSLDHCPSQKNKLLTAGRYCGIIQTIKNKNDILTRRLVGWTPLTFLRREPNWTSEPSQ